MNKKSSLIIQRILQVIVIIASVAMFLAVLSPLLAFFAASSAMGGHPPGYLKPLVYLVPITPYILLAGAVASIVLTLIRPKDELTTPLRIWGVVMCLLAFGLFTYFKF
ncbi:MAG: hypothetical protein ACREGJ_00910 [Candidatus Saccharimonadales bacterium]